MARKKTAPNRYDVLYPDDFWGKPVPFYKKIKLVHSIVLFYTGRKIEMI